MFIKVRETKIVEPAIRDQDYYINVDTPDWHLVSQLDDNQLLQIPVVQKLALKGYRLTNGATYTWGCSFLIRKAGWCRGSIHFYCSTAKKET